MTSRRSMLKGIAAACFAGWCRLRPAAAASPAAPAQAPSPSCGEEMPCDDDSSGRADSARAEYTYTYTYDADGRLTSVQYPDCQSSYYEYPAPADVT